MDLGIYDLTQYDAAESQAEVWQVIRDVAILVDESGFDSLWFGEHHVTPEDQYIQAPIALAAAAEVTSNVRLGAGSMLLPLHNPVHAAELAASIDVISDGRLVLACGLGYRDAEFDVFGVDKSTRVGRLEEGIEVMRRVWTEDHVDYDGRMFQFEDVTINPKPVQNPHPPLLVAGYVDAAGERAARIGDSWYFGNLASREELARQFAVYRNAVAEHGREDETFTPPVMREGYVLPDEDEAFETVRPYLQSKFESYAGWGLDGVDIEDDFRDAAESRFLIGSPETVLEQIKRYHDLGVEEITLRVQFPGMDPADARRSIETIADEVLPHLP
ncbi:LLM class flavin-dependent oxidoreductase [Natronomonas gomsonensis]|uniref:LLM class flavin-dependent oxidoreductase n=1 Tax=Natronomonas gomsonensis TaxID=1046043 RepID=UPI0020CA3A05|nr:LLM class flavin-dependent oxidoreductase [Natronomonas gomsonensis]MCY4729956.1 LLM class flavin-dependent oxidoreductase [Natronomonas gomsonensis]